jgi:hypothetical protein
MKFPIIRNPIRMFAVLCVAVTSIFVMWMSYKLVLILSSPEWCGKALQAERISNQNFGGLTACTDLLKIQLKALATNSFVFGGVIALCLLTLIVIVIAGGKLSLDASATGVKADIGSEADSLPVHVTNTPASPVPTTQPPTGPAMPEPGVTP